MELPDCPPGAEGYQDSVTEVPKKLDIEESCTKAEQEFQEHLNSLKLKLDDGSIRSMVERRGRDISGKWIYLCYPCAAVCSGESILQTHISGKKHKVKLSLRTQWPTRIFDEHPFNQSHSKSGATEQILQKMAEEVDLHNNSPDDLDLKYNKYRTVRCHIQDSLDNIKAPLVGVEYLIEHPPEQPHHEPSYICTLCTKQGHPRTIINHMTCFWHRYNYLVRHFPKACSRITPYRVQPKYREGVALIMNRLAKSIEDKYGHMKPVNIDKEEYEKDKDRIHQWLFKGHHFTDKNGGPTFEEVADVDLIDSLLQTNTVETKLKNVAETFEQREPSPPVVAAPSKPYFSNVHRPAGRQERRGTSMESLSDISDDQEPRRDPSGLDDKASTPSSFSKDKLETSHKPRFEPYNDRRRDHSPYRSRYAFKNAHDKIKNLDKPKNHEYKVKLAEEMRQAAAGCAKKILAYHEKNPEKHPLYPEEWKKFWNKRYKEIQAEGKDPSKHDFKPEWIVFWTKRMKELHDEELRIHVDELYRKMCLSPPDMTRQSPEKRKSEDRKRSPNAKRRTIETKRRSPYRRERRTPEFRRSSAGRRVSPLRRRSSPRRRPTGSRSRSPHHSVGRSRGVVISEYQPRRSRSPLSRRESALRNRSPHAQAQAQAHLAPSMQTVLVSDDELKPDDGLSPWNSDNDIESVCSGIETRSHGGTSTVSATRLRQHREIIRAADPHDLGPAENVIATLRMLVALEDYLGSLGPKVIDLLTEALMMEKEKANSSEDLLERDSALVLIETAKEKLKGAAQAGLVAAAAAAAVRAAVVRAAATLYAADTKAKKKRQQTSLKSKKPSPVPVAGVGEVDRAQIAQQMAAALIAQGKTDVSSEELSQLVEAVVGMAEAKKREADVKKKVELRATSNRASRPDKVASTISGTATALQMLQSAYDENDKKLDKEEIPDAMDGLSDSDLETLLKNFNELSAEEQHSLIAYLKKLEAKEPQRVERLRQYVSSDAAPAPQAELPVAKQNVAIDSDDDDDYTVEEVFMSATQKVKENQIRQEMEIVKKSLEEVKEMQPNEAESEPEPKTESLVGLANNLSSAANLLALVQASIKSTSAPTSTDTMQAADIVTSSTQPRSFGDLPEASMAIEAIKPSIQNAPCNQNSTNIVQALLQSQALQNQESQSQPFNNQQGASNRFNNQQGGSQSSNNQQGESQPFNNQQGGSQSFNNQHGGSHPFNNQQGGPQSFKNQHGGSHPFNNPQGGPQPFNNQHGGSQPFNNQQGGSLPFTKQGGSQPFYNNQGESEPFNNQHGGQQPFNKQQGSQSYNNQQGRSQPFQNDQQGGSQPFQKNQQIGSQPFQNNQQDGLQPFQKNQQGGSQPFQNNQQGGSQPFQKNHLGGSQAFLNNQQGGSQPFQKNQQGGSHAFQNNQQGGSQPFQNNQQGGSQPFQNNQQGGSQPFQKNQQGGSQAFQNNQQGGLLRPHQNHFNFDGNRNSQNNQGPWNQRSMNNNMQDNRGQPIRSAFDNYGQGGGQFNNQQGQGPRGNFMNAGGRNQDKFDTRPQDMNRQNNYDGPNFRGRGGGRNYGGHSRGRGRGYY